MSARTARCVVFGCLLFSDSLCAQINVVELTAQQISAAYDNQQFTAVELTQAFLDRIEAFEGNYNAFTTLNRDVLAQAAQLDLELVTSGRRGPLHGVPIVIKEAIDVTGMPSTMGWAAFSSEAGGVDLIPPVDAPVVARLREAGAIILGKTNIPGFSLHDTKTNDANFWPSWDGDTYNAYDRELAPGASSAGTATAVSGSFGVFGLGEETGGSIQNPSGAQNLVGIKTTFGRVPNVGVAPIGGSTLDVIGPMAKTVYDAALALDAMAGPTDEDPKTLVSADFIPDNGYTSGLSASALTGKRIGIYGSGWSRKRPSGETQVLYDAALDVLRAEGATIVDDPFADSGFRGLAANVAGTGLDLRGNESIVFDFEQYLERLLPGSAQISLEQLEAVTGVDLFDDQSGPLGFFVQAFDIARQSLVDPDLPPDLTDFENSRREYLDVFTQVLEDHNLDALAFPQMLIETPRLSNSQDIVTSTIGPINIMGTPGVTVPAGYYESGAPFSLLFLGDLFTEPQLLAFAYDYEQASKHRVAPTLINIADTNADGRVDFADFLVVRDNFGKRAAGARRGNLNGDRNVDFADFLILSKQFGHGTAAPMNVPETATSALSVVALVLNFLLHGLLRQSRLRQMDFVHPPTPFLKRSGVLCN